MKCPVCGEEYREGDRFCACCGAQLPEPASPEPVSVKQASNIPEPALTTEVDMWGPSQAKKDLENAMSNQPEEGASPFSSPYDGVSPYIVDSPRDEKASGENPAPPVEQEDKTQSSPTPPAGTPYSGEPYAQPAPLSKLPPVPPSVPAGPGAGEKDAIDRLLQVFLVICGAVLALSSLGMFFGGVGNVITTLFYRFNVILLLGRVLKTLSGAAGLLLAALLILIAMRRKPETTDALFSGVALGAVGLLLMDVLQLLLSLLYEATSYYFNGFFAASTLGTTALAMVVIVGGFYAILFVGGRAPLAGKSGPQIQQELQMLPQVISDMVSSMKKAPTQQPAGSVPPQYQQPPVYRQNPQSGTVPPPSAPAYQPPAVQVPGRLKTDRSIWMYILLGIVTCGIYDLIFLYSMVCDINKVCDGDGKNTPSLIVAILISLVTCGIYSFIWYYQMGNRLQENAPRYGLQFSENGTTVLMWQLFGALLCGVGPFIAINIIIKNTNALCAAYNAYNANNV